MADTVYDRGFYERQRGGSRSSAEVIVPLMLDMIDVQSVCDVGCGLGTWLGVFRQYGVTDLLGLDGDYVQRDLLQIASDQFRPADLSKPFDVERRFDLAILLEVAEHLPATSAESFVRSITRLAPFVLFSAAIPRQGGEDHINEQWPSYWRDMFAKVDYQAIDCIRPKVWDNDQVKWWYAQNTFLYCHSSRVAELLPRRVPEWPVSIAHPKNYLQQWDTAPPQPLYLSQLAAALPGAIRNAIASRISGALRKQLSEEKSGTRSVPR